MTADEYMELRKRIEKYEQCNNVLKTLTRLRNYCKTGIMTMTPVGDSITQEILCSYTGLGDGFQELVTQKVLEAFDEQISRIEKQMEEL